MNPTTIAEMQAKAAELRAKYPWQAVIVEASVWHYNHAAPELKWRIHVVSEGTMEGAAETGSDIELIEAEIAKLLDPAQKQARALARAAELEAEAAALRASVGGAA